MCHNIIYTRHHLSVKSFSLRLYPFVTTSSILSVSWSAACHEFRCRSGSVAALWLLMVPAGVDLDLRRRGFSWRRWWADTKTRWRCRSSWYSVLCWLKQSWLVGDDLSASSGVRCVTSGAGEQNLSEYIELAVLQDGWRGVHELTTLSIPSSTAKEDYGFKNKRTWYRSMLGLVIEQWTFGYTSVHLCILVVLSKISCYKNNTVNVYISIMYVSFTMWIPKKYKKTLLWLEDP